MTAEKYRQGFCAFAGFIFSELHETIETFSDNNDGKFKLQLSRLGFCPQ